MSYKPIPRLWNVTVEELGESTTSLVTVSTRSLRHAQHGLIEETLPLTRAKKYLGNGVPTMGNPFESNIWTRLMEDD